jgi:hypothetical protein
MAAILFCAPAFAAGDKGDDAWHFSLAPFYLWAVSLDGEVGSGPKSTEVSADFDQIFDNLEGMFTAHAEGQKGCWGGIFDIAYLDIGSSAGLPSGAEIKVNVINTMVEVDGFYRIKKDAHFFDILAGFRYSDQEVKVNIRPGPRANTNEDWWDPLVGGRWIWNFGKQWQLVGRGDIGGFGVGSEFTWNASGLLVWQPWKHVALAAGYRGLYQDYENGSGADRYKWDVTMHGPLAGVDFRW